MNIPNGLTKEGVKKLKRQEKAIKRKQEAIDRATQRKDWERSVYKQCDEEDSAGQEYIDRIISQY